MQIFNAGAKVVITFILLWIILAFSSLICFQIWWDRKSKLSALLNKKEEEFLATPFLSHFIQTLGESVGTYIGIVTAEHPVSGKLYNSVFYFQVGGADLGTFPLFVGLLILIQLGYWLSNGGYAKLKQRHAVRNEIS